ncbi:MAG: sensor histidine kinase [Gammaproteobacteria bacterium]
MKVRLRYILTAAFTVVAVVPLMFLGFWVDRTALNKEIDAVREKHLLLADHTAALLERYAEDLERTFGYFERMKHVPDADDASLLVARHFGFRHFCIVDDNGRVIRDIGPLSEKTRVFNKKIVAALLPTAYNQISYSPVMANPSGDPMIYLYRRVAENRIALAALDTEYLVRLQKTVTFGKRGHAAIVDQDGNVIAHPRDEWRREMRNLAEIEPVTRMMDGERGVVVFYSPALSSDMVSGYTTVAQTGWGVMVPQPMEELEARAADLKRVALIVSVFGIAAAAFLSWVFAGRLTRPIEAVQTTAQRIAAGKINSRVPPLPRFTASDLAALADDFNEMANRIQNDQKTLATALSRAQSADQAKTRFLANMSHELRTPLNAIIGFSETMENQIFGPIGNQRYIDYAADIRQSGQHLLSIINYILDLSKIEGGDISIEEDAVDVAPLVHSVQAMLKQAAADGGIALDADIGIHLPTIRGSEVKLKQVLLNLVSNAVKYTPEGGTVVIGARPDDGGGIAISVSDTGIGMSKEDQTTALLPFGRVDNDMSDRVNGAGLGLPLAKRFVELHGGRIEIQSARGSGTTITVHLPASRTITAVA